jgi:hypothetical protein
MVGSCLCSPDLYAQRKFNAWLSTCSHLVGPTGNGKTLGLAVDQSRGKYADAPAFDWDVLIDLGDWTASQGPPNEEEGLKLAELLEKSLGKDRGRFFSVSGNHDGDPIGWEPGAFTRKYVNPLWENEHLQTARLKEGQTPNEPDFRQLIEYPGTRWDRYLVRTGNVVWVMMGDRNEFDYLALARKDLTGAFQAGRGSAEGMPRGGYPSGSVTLDTFEWWKKVVEDPAFAKDILITAHHHMPAFTTITTEDGEPGEYHGKSGSVGPNGETGGQLYWIREYSQEGKEVNQYAQTRPFLNYLRDHPGAIAAWIGGHTHIHAPESEINGRGMHVRKYDVTFISVGALTDSHAGGLNQMTRMLTFEEGSDQALLSVYVHRSRERRQKGWVADAARRVPLGREFICPESVDSRKGPLPTSGTALVPLAPQDPPKARYHWRLDHSKTYDFNNDRFLVGEDGSPYGRYEGVGKPTYTDDTPSGSGRSLNLETTDGRFVFDAPYSPEMNWKSLTVNVWVKTVTNSPQEIVASCTPGKPDKFRLWYDGKAFVWEVGEKKRTRRAKSKGFVPDGWHLITGIVDGDAHRIQLYVDRNLVADVEWKGDTLNQNPDYRLTLGDSLTGKRKSSRFRGLVHDLQIHETVKR